MSSRLILSLSGAALLLCAAPSAWAEQAKAGTTDFTVKSETSIAVPGARNLKWDARKGRWGVTLNLSQSAERDSQWSDVQAGAYFRLTPALRIGGAVALGDQEQSPASKKTPLQDAAPRVRLETAFKF